MSTLERLSRLRAFFEQGGVTPGEMAVSVVDAILEGEISTFEDCKDLISLNLSEVMLRQIRALEFNDYVDPRQFVKDGLSDEEKKERAVRLRPVYEKIFSQIKSYLGDLEKSETVNDP